MDSGLAVHSASKTRVNALMSAAPRNDEATKLPSPIDNDQNTPMV